jgi:hypothetical protein
MSSTDRGGIPHSIAVEKRLEQAARTIPAQHRKIRELIELLLAGARGGGNHLPETLSRLGEALEAHFALEERFFFPSLRDAHPELAARFEALCGEHQRIRGDLADLRKPLRGPGPAASRAVQDFASLLAGHESREEDLVKHARAAG